MLTKLNPNKEPEPDKIIHSVMGDFPPPGKLETSHQYIIKVVDQVLVFTDQ
jgi:hypothetical protein